MKKIKVLKELLKLVEENYFSPYFQDRVKEYSNNRELPILDVYELKDVIRDFLECRIIELEEDNNY